MAFSCVGVKIWNGIPTSLKNLSKNSFKTSIRTKLIEILEIENSYVDMDTLINISVEKLSATIFVKKTPILSPLFNFIHTGMDENQQ